MSHSNDFDPLGDDGVDSDDYYGCGDSYCHICGDDSDEYEDDEPEDDD